MKEVRFSENLRKLRRKRGMSIMQLADAAHSNRSAVFKWEHGRRDPNMLSIAELCNALDCSADELLFGGADDEI